MKHKSDATSTWKSMISSVKSLGHKISRLRINNDIVLLSKEVTLVCEFEGIEVGQIVATPHPQCSMKHQISFRSTIPKRTKWLMGAIKLVGRLPPVTLPECDP